MYKIELPTAGIGDKLKIVDLADLKPHHSKIGSQNAGIVILCVSENLWYKAFTAKDAWVKCGKPKKAVFYAIWAAITLDNHCNFILNEKYFPRFTDNIDDLIEVMGHIG